MLSELITVTLPLKRPFGISRSTTVKKELILLRMDGTALGEASPNAYYKQTIENTREMLKGYLPHFKGDPTFIEDVMVAARSIMGSNTAALATFDIALHDWIGKKFQIPLYEYLGIHPDPEKFTTFTISLGDYDVMLKEVEERCDFAMLKIKLGKDAEKEMELMKEIRRRTNQRLMVDANGGWTLEEALKCVKVLGDLDIEYIEQPLERGRLDETAHLRANSPLPIYLDEDVHTGTDIPKVVGKCDGINIKLMKCGGVLEARKMIAIARALGLKIMLGCMIETSVAITAAAHLSALVDYCDLDGHILLAEEPFEGMKVDKGRIILPTTPGLGVTEVNALPWTKIN